MLKIVAVCGHGLGSSLVLKMTLDNVITEMGINALLETTSVTEATGALLNCDIIVTTEELAKLIDAPTGKPLVTVKNLLNVEEVGKKIYDAVKAHYPREISK
jgi:PTS system ascorbate-specific IIB component